MTEGEKPTHQEMIERIEWPLLDCMQEYHFFYVPSRDDVSDYRFGFARELMLKRGKMHQLWINDLVLCATIFDQQLLFQAPRYKDLFRVLGPAEWRSGTEATFAGALTWGGRFGRSLNEELFALIAVAQDGNDRKAIRVAQDANALFAAAGVPPIEWLFLIAAGSEFTVHNGSTTFGDVDSLENEYAGQQHIIETFQYNKTIYGLANYGPDGQPQRVDRRAAQRCKTIVIRVPLTRSA
jgi:hypothetical protein